MQSKLIGGYRFFTACHGQDQMKKRPAQRFYGFFTGGDLPGIEIDQVTDELEAEGVQKFATSFEELLETIDSRRTELLTAG